MELHGQLQQLAQADSANEQFQQSGQHIITRIVGHYPHITHEVNRDLFWFFGGECLHFMGDDEISLYQQLDELFHESSEIPISYTEAKARVCQLH